jgi:(p)ppGpp synthase/HD superfamily hydrolase
MDAVSFAKIAHSGQKRRTGEDFMDHVLAVRQILIEAGIRDAYILDAALLHDCLEDGDISKEYLGFRFGATIADIVDTLSKEKLWHTSYVRAKSHLHALERGWVRYPEATLIKIADRLHNLQTISGFSAKKQREYLQETRRDLLPLFRRILEESAAGKFRTPIKHLLHLLEAEVATTEEHLSSFA